MKSAEVLKLKATVILILIAQTFPIIVFQMKAHQTMIVVMIAIQKKKAKVKIVAIANQIRRLMMKTLCVIHKFVLERIVVMW